MARYLTAMIQKADIICVQAEDPSQISGPTQEILWQCLEQGPAWVTT